VNRDLGRRSEVVEEGGQREERGAKDSMNCLRDLEGHSGGCEPALGSQSLHRLEGLQAWQPRSGAEHYDGLDSKMVLPIVPPLPWFASPGRALAL